MKAKKAVQDSGKKRPKNTPTQKNGAGPILEEVRPSACVVQNGAAVRSARERPSVKLTQQQLEAHLWGAANILRGKTAGQDYKNYILSLMFFKRLSDQWEHEADEAIKELEQQQGRVFTESERAIFRQRGEHRFTIPEGARWA